MIALGALLQPLPADLQSSSEERFLDSTSHVVCIAPLKSKAVPIYVLRVVEAQMGTACLWGR